MNLFCSKKYKKTKDVFFISYTCSGATFLENIIIELGIRLKFEQEKNDGDFFKFNKRIDKFTDEFLTTKHILPSQFGLPSLVNRNKFNFRNDLAVFFTHNTDFFSEDSKTFILVRDPRDTLLSQFKMNHDKDPKLFLEFCQNNINAWIDFYNNALSHKNFYIIKFEDLKLNSFLTLRNLMLFLNLSYEEQELCSAISNSTFEKTKEIEDKMIKEHPEIAKDCFPNRITKSGKCYQYKLKENSSLTESFSFVEDKASDLISRLGY